MNFDNATTHGLEQQIRTTERKLGDAYRSNDIGLVNELQDILDEMFQELEESDAGEE